MTSTWLAVLTSMCSNVATAQGRVVVTHDLAFGRSAIRAGASFVGIIYLRPGHISVEFVLEPC